MSAPSGRDYVIAELIERRAASQPDDCAMQFVGGPEWSFAELRDKVRSTAAGLQALGVQQGDFVLSWQPNGPTAVTTLLALNYLGAVYVPLNTSYRGAILEHVIENSGAALMIAHGQLLGRLEGIKRSRLARIVVLGEERPDIPGIAWIDARVLAGGEEFPDPPARAIAPWDVHMVIYTSGTTGPSKGVLSTYVHSATSARQFLHVGPGDCIYVPLPLFHVGGTHGVLFALLHGIRVVFDESFRTASFWSLIDRYRVTTTGLLGGMAASLLAQPDLPTDRAHSLRKVLIAPFDSWGVKFAERFGVEVFTLFNMTELSVPLWAGPNPPARAGLCGRPRAGLSIRLVDEHDGEVAEGCSGELIVRADEPWTLSHGYHRDAAATAAAWRNGWFHTGDLFRRDPDGHYLFVDRLKDALRRRGENISSFEVENAIALHPLVRDVAVVAAAGTAGEDEVLAVVSPVEGAVLDPRALLEFLKPRLPHFMLPRYVRVLAALPKTPTHKTEKHRLRAEGVTADTWDREACGIDVRREALESRG
jgi:crotonobetaine/carnitine-CoA ligase